MNQTNIVHTNLKKQDRFYLLRADVFLIILFTVFLTPFYYKGMSINYSFLLFPIFVVIITGRVVRPDSLILGFIILISLVFIFSILSLDEYQFWLRRCLSFIIVFSLASFSFIQLNQRIIRNFAYALVILSAILTIPVFYNLIVYGEISNVLLLKGEFGNQRVVLIHLMAFFWLLYKILFEKNSKFARSILILFGSISFIGIMLSYSRSAYIAVFATLFLISYSFFRHSFKIKHLPYLIIGFFFFFFFGFYLDIFYDFFEFTFIKPLYSGELLSNFLSAGNSSEGVRIQIWTNILNYILVNPFIGSGFLGYWVTTSDFIGSSHSDYMDRFFRFGIPLFIFYIYMLIKVLIYLRHRFTNFYFGYISLLIFGFFHEAFALSSGAVILSFLLGLYSQRKSLENSIV